MALILASTITTILTLILILILQGNLSHLFGVEDSPSVALSLIKDFLVPISSSFGGALLGAIGAYRLALRKDKKDEKEEELTLLTSAFFVLKAQLNDLIAIKKSIILPYQDKPVRMISIPTATYVNSVEQRVPEKVFSVLIKYKLPVVAESIHIAERRYLNQKEIHGVRNELIRSYYEHLERGGVCTFDFLSLDESCKLFGINNMCQLYSMTEHFISFTDDSIYSLLAAMKDLQDAIDTEFSDDIYVKIRFEIPSKNQEYLEPAVPPYFQSINHLLGFLKKPKFELKMYKASSYRVHIG
ncbi:hypothetical protein NUT31_05650 [Aeromonas sp. BC14]|nr:hypothetical protein [Aeromonas sp. BC14]WAF95939.1 hypothetical protein NUT31_05650 [Aeromonas sp. BC14]